MSFLRLFIDAAILICTWLRNGEKTKLTLLITNLRHSKPIIHADCRVNLKQEKKIKNKDDQNLKAKRGGGGLGRSTFCKFFNLKKKEFFILQQKLGQISNSAIVCLIFSIYKDHLFLQFYKNRWWFST